MKRFGPPASLRVSVAVSTSDVNAARHTCAATVRSVNSSVFTYFVKLYNIQPACRVWTPMCLDGTGDAVF